MAASEPNQNLTVDVGTLSGFPNTRPPTPTSGVPNFTHILAIFIHPTMVDSKIDHPARGTNTSNAGASVGSIPITQHLPATTSEENTVAGVGNLVRIISYSEQSCQIEILATGERKFLPTKMLYHPSATNHFHCSRTCPCQQDPEEVMGEEEIEQQPQDTVGHSHSSCV